MQLEHSYEKLKTLLRGYGRVAVAFSGGADSSFLLKCALDTLGVDKVLVLFANSELLIPDEISHVRQWLQAHGYGAHEIEMKIVELQPLGWEEFVSNGKDRCYFCKLQIYSAFRRCMDQRGFTWLLDGTNTVDLNQPRAGLRAVRELGVSMPLAEADLSKGDIRLLSQQLGLNTWDRPSSSCLATRIPTGMRITRKRLQQVAALESGLERFGLVGCRVRLCANQDHEVHVEIRSRDFACLADPNIRMALLGHFQQHGVSSVQLSLRGRE